MRWISNILSLKNTFIFFKKFIIQIDNFFFFSQRNVNWKSGSAQTLDCFRDYPFADFSKSLYPFRKYQISWFKQSTTFMIFLHLPPKSIIYHPIRNIFIYHCANLNKFPLPPSTTYEHTRTVCSNFLLHISQNLYGNSLCWRTVKKYYLPSESNKMEIYYLPDNINFFCICIGWLFHSFWLFVIVLSSGYDILIY